MTRTVSPVTLLGRDKPVGLRRPLDPDWRINAACRGMGNTEEGISKWFPGPGGSQSGKKICAQCPVTRECEDFAEEADLEWGIYGGKIRHRKQRKSHTPHTPSRKAPPCKTAKTAKTAKTVTPIAGIESIGS